MGSGGWYVVPANTRPYDADKLMYEAPGILTPVPPLYFHTTIIKTLQSLPSSFFSPVLITLKPALLASPENQQGQNPTKAEPIKLCFTVTSCRRGESLLPRDADQASLQHAAGQLLAEQVGARTAPGRPAAAGTSAEEVEHQVRAEEFEHEPCV